MNQQIFNTLIKLTNKAIKKDEVPVACVIVKNNKIVAKAYNLKEKYNNPMYHAEIICINKLCKKIKNWRLDEYELYVTLKPCNMCLEIIKAARIKKVYYFLDAKNSKNNRKIELEKLQLNDADFRKKITLFFKSKR